MIVIPAIDIKNGKVVRLKQGKAEEATVYFDSPLETAKMWAAKGAELIHVVDLDGAIEGKSANTAVVREMAKACSAGIELGGGLRDEKTIKEALDAGVKRVVVGTRALDEKFISDMIKKFGADKIIVGIDAREGLVCTKGWLFRTKIKAVDMLKDMAGAGVKTVIYTDISKDGMLGGPNIASLRSMLKAAKIDVIASGGISSIEDVKQLKALESDGLKGMIIGKALYEGVVDLKEAIRICT